MIDGVEWIFINEIFLRSLIMFLLVLIVLRLSGKRGVRQLTMFEVAIILSLGSIAGDPMFQEEIPIIYAIVVLFTVILFYKLIAWLASKSAWFHRIMEGKPVIIIRDGQFVMYRHKLRFSRREFFPELRNQSVEHLGQVRTGILEIDGTVSLLFYTEKQVRPGLPIFPDHYSKAEDIKPKVFYACMYCGYVTMLLRPTLPCPRCARMDWAEAMSGLRESWPHN